MIVLGIPVGPRGLPHTLIGEPTLDDWLRVLRSDEGGVLLVAWTTASFGHITRIPVGVWSPAPAARRRG